MPDVTRQDSWRDVESGQHGDTGLLDGRVVDNLELERVHDYESVPQEDAVGGKTDDMTITVGQMDEERGQRGDTEVVNITPEPQEDNIVPTSLLNGRCSKSRKGVTLVVCLLVVIGISIVLAITLRSANSPVDKNLTSATNLTLSKSQVNQSEINVQLAEKTCADGWKKYGDSCYYIFKKTTEQETWQRSRERCLETGADLVIVNSKEEQVFINGLGYEGGEAWIGLRRNGSNWMWVDGTPLTTLYWQDRYPVDGDASCTSHYYLKDEGGWNNVQCDNKRHWICERS